jgi:hypothetical protein
MMSGEHQLIIRLKNYEIATSIIFVKNVDGEDSEEEKKRQHSKNYIPWKTN